MSTHIYMGCPKCGYSCRGSIYGYVEDPLGVTLTKCPRCGQIFKDSKHKEWLQMSPIKKYFSIAPRGNFVSIFLALLPAMAISFEAHIESGIGILGILAVSWLIADYIVIAIRVNSKARMDCIISSISRTNNENYVRMLSKFGKIYDNSIPKVLLLTRANRERLENTIKNKKTEGINIPTFENSISNC